MGESRAKSKFGQVDLGIDDEADHAFGELDWDVPTDPGVAPTSTTQASEPERGPSSNVNTRQTVRRHDDEMEAVVDSTRIASHKALAPLLEEAPSRSHVSTNDRVAEMREAYARGDAEGALAIANAMEAVTVPPPPAMRNHDYPDASIDGVSGEETEIDVEDPVHAKDLTRIAPSASIPPQMLAVRPSQAPGSPPASALGSLTERQGIPRVLLGPQEISKLPIDHRAGFLLGFIDGMQTMEEILDVCAMPQSEALELIRSLVDMGVIEIE